MTISPATSAPTTEGLLGGLDPEQRAAAMLPDGYDNYHRLHGELDWHRPAERFGGTPFTDRRFTSVRAPG